MGCKLIQLIIQKAYMDSKTPRGKFLKPEKLKFKKYGEQLITGGQYIR